MKHKKKMTRAERVIAFIHRYCRVPEGMYVGHPLILEKFQQKFIRRVFDNPHITKRAILSMARKNAKTVLIACFVLAYLVGPLAEQNSQIVSGAMDENQAALIFNSCCKIIRLNKELEKLVQIKESVFTLIGLPMRVEYNALSANAKTKHGLSPLVVIMDELGQVVGPRSELFETLETAQGAHKDPIMFIISTQAPTDGDLLSILIDDALAGADPRIICDLYTAPDGCTLMDEKAWMAANPALGLFRSEEDVRDLATQAVRMPSKEASFRNLILNQRISTNNPLFSKEAWKACGAQPYPIEECSELYGALDLSKRTDLTAYVILGWHPESGTWNAYAFFWMPADDLIERAKRDRVQYDVWVAQGYIITTPGKTIDYEFVAQELGEINDGFEFMGIAFDRWRMDVLKKEMERAGIDLPLVEWGQGFKDMSPAIDAFEDMVLNAKLRHGNNPVLTMCVANSMVTQDPAGNRKLDKTKTSGRIDGSVATAMAAGLAAKEQGLSGAFTDFIKDPLIL